ncbi:hypothetical protein CA983_13675 [Streptomyces swartbergensis]|uniref:Luciferase-like domain-containing protein n=1 Tax=Streptomyces swartbergensis TaxID=487165 RepID=A0A243S559_9ACTN|nr:hypothetical protein CA983_13675 [Streptomyces swartbergensis]
MLLSVLDQSPVPEGSSPADALRHSLELAVLADRLGYHRYWCTEHHASPFQAGAAPAIMIGQILERTTGIRVGSGGLLLPYYSPFLDAEVFRVLHALYPGRVDLGVGKAHLSKAPSGAALRRDTADPHGQNDFLDKVRELRAFLFGGGFPPGHSYKGLRLTPDMPAAPEMWVLGSSVSSAESTARLGLPYAYAHFLGRTTRPRRCATTGRRSYRTSWTARRPPSRASSSASASTAPTPRPRRGNYSPEPGAGEGGRRRAHVPAARRAAARLGARGGGRTGRAARSRPDRARTGGTHRSTVIRTNRDPS